MNSATVIAILDVVIPALVRLAELWFAGSGRGAEKKAAVLAALPAYAPGMDLGEAGQLVDETVAALNVREWRDAYDTKFRRDASVDHVGLIALLGATGRSDNPVAVTVDGVRYPVVGVRAVPGETALEVGEGAVVTECCREPT